MKFLKANILLSITFISFAFSVNTNADTPCNNQTDPYENFNRNVYGFNKTVDKIVLKPAAIFYKKLLPWPVTKGVSNFFNNLNTVPTIINDALQGNGYYTARDTTRLVINSTFGIGGLFDVACYGGLPNHTEDFGLTLAKWGYHSSNYLVLPFLGPSTIRDTIAIPMDYYVFSPYPYIFPRYWDRVSLLALYYIDLRSQFLPLEGVMKEAAIDQYVFERNMYLQHRAVRIAENNACPGDTTTPGPEKNMGTANEAYTPGGSETVTVTKTTTAVENYTPGGNNNAPSNSLVKNSGTAEENYVPGG